jgi:hypothetical protein
MLDSCSNMSDKLQFVVDSKKLLHETMWISLYRVDKLKFIEHRSVFCYHPSNAIIPY